MKQIVAAKGKPIGGPLLSTLQNGGSERKVRPTRTYGAMMAEEQPSLHIDNDWKKQAQEEKKRLAEKAAQAKAAPPPAAPAPLAPPGAAPAAGASAAPAGPSGARASARARTGQRELPAASIA